MRPAAGPCRYSLARIRTAVALFLLLSTFAAFASAQPVVNSLSPAQAQNLVARVLSTELRTARDSGHPMRYLLHKTSPRLTSTKEIVETRDGDVARLLSINDQPLSPDAEKQELARLGTLAGNPGLQTHRKQSEDQDLHIILKLLRMLPGAFFYQYAGAGQGPAGPVYKFAFRPNPRFDPPDMESEALTAMSGELWIDVAQERVVRLEGHLNQDTSYAWGILGKLNRGGWLAIEQADVGGRQWRIVHVQMDMSLRILFKTKLFKTEERMTRYAPIAPGLDYRQAIQILRSSNP